MIQADIAIIGAGMAGASLASEIGDAARVVLIEMEAQPGYHATGRSAAFWSETYGGPAIQPLTTASGPLLEAGGYLHSRGALTIAESGSEHLLKELLAEFEGTGVALEWRERSALESMVPSIRPGWTAGVAELKCRDIDVAALHADYLATARRSGAQLLVDAEVLNIMRSGGGWSIETRNGTVKADLVVNAAGAWATPIARAAGAMPITIQPFRRTVVQILVDPPAPADLPLVMDAADRFYFKPEAGGRLWVSPHDEAPTEPCDAAPEELDIALAIDRFERAMACTVLRVERSWAGLRSFAPDRVPVYGFDNQASGFFWFAGQGGFGIQTAPAAAAIGASLILNKPVPDGFEKIDADRYSPARF